MIDEGPSSEDIERFDRDVAFCPECGAEIWDQAEVCPECHAYVGGQTSTREPMQKWVDRRFVAVIVILLLIAFGVLWLLSRPAAL